MKRILALVLTALIAVSLTACGTKAAESGAPASGDSLAITILYEQDESMINTYSLIAVDPAAPFVDADGNPVSGVSVNTVGAKALADWMFSEAGAAAIREYGFADYGEYLFYNMDGRPVSSAAIPAATEATKQIRLSTTTSVNDSGLLGYLLPMFEEAYGYKVEVYSAGTGKAIANAKYGNADLILVHAKAQEEAFIADGFGLVMEGYDAARLSFMYNYFVLIGPKDDPAKCAAAPTVLAAFEQIAKGGHPFVSRGDLSGTHTKELSLWPESLGITKEADSVKGYAWYTYSNAGMGTCLTMANETGAYILSDKATFLTFRANGGTVG